MRYLNCSIIQNMATNYKCSGHSMNITFMEQTTESANYSERENNKGTVNECPTWNES